MMSAAASRRTFHCCVKDDLELRFNYRYNLSPLNRLLVVGLTKQIPFVIVTSFLLSFGVSDFFFVFIL